MISFLNECRRVQKPMNLRKEITNTALVLAVGLLLGAFAKWLDTVAIDETIAWTRVLGYLDLRNVFSELAIWALIALAIAIFSRSPIWAAINVFLFFIGMMIAYYAFTVLVAGFFPQTQMMAWGIITSATPFLAFLTWYSKGDGWVAVILSFLINAFFCSQAIHIGFFYFGISGAMNLLIWIASIRLLHQNLKRTLLTTLGAFVLAPLTQTSLLYIFGGL